MGNIHEIIQKIKDSVRPAMEQWEEDSFQWLKSLEIYCKFTVYSETHNSSEAMKLRKNAGWTKTLEKYFDRPEGELKQMIHKEAEKKLLSIDTAVIKKLQGVTISTLELLYFTTNGKGCFCEGAWKINDERIFSFQSFYAGGWNIQRQHVRMIYKYFKDGETEKD